MEFETMEFTIFHLILAGLRWLEPAPAVPAATTTSRHSAADTAPAISSTTKAPSTFGTAVPLPELCYNRASLSPWPHRLQPSPAVGHQYLHCHHHDAATASPC